MAVLVIRTPNNGIDRVKLGEKPILIGRHTPADVFLNDPAVSGTHAKVYAHEGRFVLRDLASLNGTFVNGERVTERAIDVGDEIRIGNVKIAVAPEAEDGQEGSDSTAVLDESHRGNTPIGATTASVRLDVIGDSLVEWAGVDDRLALVWRAGEKINRLTGRDEVFVAVRELLDRAFAPGRAYVIEPRKGGTELAVVAGKVDPSRPPSRSVTTRAISTRSAVLSVGMASDERFKQAKSVRAGQITTAIAAPLLCGGEAVAAIYVDRVTRPSFTNTDLRLLGLIANQVAAAVANADLVLNLEAKVAQRTAELRRKAEEMAALAAEKDELIGIAAHDIRNPLTTILGFVELAREGLKTGDAKSVDETLAIVEDATRNVTRLVSDLLDLKKVEAGKIRIETQDLDAQAFLAQATALGALKARQRGVDFAVEPEPGLVIRGDPRRLEQVVANLVGNAVKFTKQGGSVRVRARRAGATVEVSVCDTGPGIKPEELRDLFGAYVQGEAGRKSGGHGLGLAIAKKLVELHGGRIWAESVEGKGSVFGFTIPANPRSC